MNHDLTLTEQRAADALKENDKGVPFAERALSDLRNGLLKLAAKDASLTFDRVDQLPLSDAYKAATEEVCARYKYNMDGVSVRTAVVLVALENAELREELFTALRKENIDFQPFDATIVAQAPAEKAGAKAQNHALNKHHAQLVGVANGTHGGKVSDLLELKPAITPQHNIRHVLLDPEKDGLRTDTTIVDTQGQVRGPWAERMGALVNESKAQATIKTPGIHELLAAHRLFGEDKSFADAVGAQLQADRAR